MNGNGNENNNGDILKPTTDNATTAEEMTSRDYYFDSYAHFGMYLKI